MGTSGRRVIETALVGTDFSASLFILLDLFIFLKPQND